jgi:hypothetical protein
LGIVPAHFDIDLMVVYAFRSAEDTHFGKALLDLMFHDNSVADDYLEVLKPQEDYYHLLHLRHLESMIGMTLIRN